MRIRSRRGPGSEARLMRIGGVQSLRIDTRPDHEYILYGPEWNRVLLWATTGASRMAQGRVFARGSPASNLLGKHSTKHPNSGTVSWCVFPKENVQILPELKSSVARCQMANPNEKLERGVKKLKDQGYTVTTYGRADSTNRYRKYHYEVNRRYKASRKELESSVLGLARVMNS
jgi:hypothetical protein